jgi:hypothetical protein
MKRAELAKSVELAKSAELATLATLAELDIAPALEGMTPPQKHCMLLAIRTLPKEQWDAWIKEKLVAADSYWKGVFAKTI